MKKAKIIIVGATGMVGETLLKVLEERKFPISSLTLVASENSSGKKISFNNIVYEIYPLDEKLFNEKYDIAFFTAGEAVSFKYAKRACNQGTIVIDNSSTFRMEHNVPLVIPQVNGVEVFNHQGIIANPNCVTIQAVLPLSVIHNHYGIKRIIYNTYQAVSGSGYKGALDLIRGQEGLEPLYYPKPIANNCLPQIDEFTYNTYTVEEMKMVNETRKILNDYSINISATCVRVPIKNGHSMAINVECVKQFDIEDLIKKLKEMPGLVVYDYPNYPTALDVCNQDLVHVGRIRRDFSIEKGLNMWVCADNLRRGAATNAVEIAEMLWKE